MIIQHNMISSNTYRQREITRKNNVKSSEKLSSGYKINRAADDAAGLSISEKMRAQIRGLTKASSNIQDGISLIQTAEGALDEVGAMLHRMRELAVQAANDTYTNKDRDQIQKEIDHLLEEVDRITNDTEFNKIKVLRGKEGNSTAQGASVGGLPSWVKRTDSGYLSSEYTNYYAGRTVIATSGSGSNTLSMDTIKDSPGNIYGNMEYILEDIPAGSGNLFAVHYLDGTATGAQTAFSDIPSDPVLSPYTSYFANIGDKITINTTKAEVAHEATMVDFSSINASKLKNLISSDRPQGFFSTCCTCEERYSIKFVNDVTNPSSVTSSGEHQIFNINLHDLMNETDVDGKKFVDFFLKELASIPGNEEKKSSDGNESYGIDLLGHYTLITKDETNYPGQLIIYDGRANTNTSLSNNTQFLMNSIQGFAGSATAGNNWGMFGVGVYYSREDVHSQPLFIQTGANSKQSIKLPWPYVSADTLGVKALSIKPEHQDFPIQRLDNALYRVNAHRAEYGAYQNRLEYAMENAENTAENLQSAESLLRDANIAEEMVIYSKEKVLQQVQDSILAQAKDSGQELLSLLQV